MLTHPALLVVDEIGYLPVSQDGAVLFFQLINARHERASTVLTSYKGFEDWGGVLGDEVMAAALIDRLVHHCHIVNIRGNSYRMRDHHNLLHPARIDTARRPRSGRRPAVDSRVVLPDSSPVAAPTRLPTAPPRPTTPPPRLGDNRKLKVRNFQSAHEKLSVGIDTTHYPDCFAAVL